MKKILLSLSFLSVVLGTFTAHAHDVKYHKGKPVHGTVTTVKPDGFDLETADGTLHVVLDKDATIEKDKSSASKEDIKRGMHVSVFGTKLESGELVARAVVTASETSPCPTGDEQCAHGMGMTHSDGKHE